MAELVGQNQQGTFSTPENGTSPIDADEVKANDNAVRVVHNAHDSDGTIHVQSSTLAARPSFGTVGRKWATVDAGVVRLWYDTGSAWAEVSYISSESDADINGELTFIVSPLFPEDVTFQSNVQVNGNVFVYGTFETGDVVAHTGIVVEAGGVDVTGNSEFDGDVQISGDVVADSFTGSGAGLTSLPAAQLGGTIDNARLPSAISVTSVVTSGTTTAAGFRSASGASYGFRTTSSGSNVTVDASTTNHHRHTLSGSGTITISNMQDGQRLLIEQLQDGTGGRALAFSGVAAWAGGTTPTFTTTANRKDLLGFVKCGTDVIGVVIGQNISSTT